MSLTISVILTATGLPSSLASICIGLPQPRSSSELTAAMRAVSDAVLLRMMPTRTAIAVRVWVRASSLSFRLLCDHHVLQNEKPAAAA